MKASRFVSLLALLACLTAVLGFASSASAATYTWDSSGVGTTFDGSGTWSTSSFNWWNGGDYAWTTSGTDSAVFGSGTGSVTPYTVTLGSNVAMAGLAFANQDYTIAGDAGGLYGMTIGSGGITATASASISAPLFLSAPQTWTTATGELLAVSGSVSNGGNLLTLSTAGSAVISGVISGGGGLTSGGAGKTYLSGANTYTGNTSVAAGTLDLRNSLALQNSTLTSGAVVFDSVVGSHAFTFGGLSGSTGFALTDNGGNPVSLSVGNNNAATTYSGAMSGAGSLTITGSGFLDLTAGNTFTGATLISSGSLQIGTNTALQSSMLNTSGTGTLVFASAATSPTLGGLSGSGNLTLPTTVTVFTLAPATGVSTTYSGNLAGGTSLNIVKNGAGIQTLSGNVVATNGTNISSGTLNMNGFYTNDAGFTITTNNSTLNINPGATLYQNTPGGNGINIGNSGSTGNVAVNVYGTFNFSSPGAIRIGTDPNSGSTASVQTMHIFNGGAVNTSIGGVYVLFQNESAYPVQAALTMDAGSLLTLGNSASFQFVDVTNANYDANDTAILNLNGGTIQTSVPFVDHSSAGQLCVEQFKFNGGLIVATSSSTNLISLDTKTANGLSSGIYLLSGSAAGGTGSGGALFNTNGYAITISQPLLHSVFSDSANVDGGVTLNDTAAIPGTLTLGGSNTYNGPTIIQAGTLALGAAGSINNSGTISIANSATFNVTALGAGYSLASGQTLTGTGKFTVSGSMSAASGSIIMPGGATSYGTLNVGGLTLNAGSILKYDFSGGSQDLINVTGNNGLNVAGGGIDLFQANGTSQITSTGVYTIADYVGTLSGSAANLSVLNPVAGDGYSFAASGSLLTVTVSPLTASTWNGNGSPSVNWSNSANWTSGAIPSNGFLITFSGTKGLSNNNDLSSLNAGGLTFTSSAGAFNLTGNSIQLSGPIGNNSTATQTIGLNIGLIGNQSVIAAAGNVVFSGVISDGGGGFGITTSGTGTVVLSGNNTYIGTTVVNSGVLQLSASGGPAISGNLTVAGGTAQLLGNSQIAGAASVSSGLLSIGAFSNSLTGLQLTGGTIAATTGTITSNTAYDMEAGVEGAILAGPAGLSKTAGGTVYLSNANTFTGGTSVAAGVLDLQNSLALQNSTLINGAVTFDSIVGSHAFVLGGLSGSGNIALSDNASNPISLSVGNNNSATTYSGVMSGAGSLTITGSGSLDLVAGNTFTGTTFINSGSLQIGTNLALQGSILNTSGSGTLTFASAATSPTFAGLSGSGNITLPSTVSVFSVATATGVSTTYSGNLAGASTNLNIVKNGLGVLTFSGTDVASNGTNVNGGTLDINGFYTNDAGFTVIQNSTLNINPGATLFQNTPPPLGNGINIGNSSSTGNSTLNVYGTYNFSSLGPIRIGTDPNSGSTASVQTMHIFNGGAVNVSYGGVYVLFQNESQYPVQAALTMDAGSVLTLGSNTYFQFVDVTNGNYDANDTAILNLNGGTIQTAASFVDHSSAGELCVEQFKFNGGLIVAENSSTNFISLDSTTVNGLSSGIYVLSGSAAGGTGSGGALFNTNGYVITIAQPLLHTVFSDSGSVDGGLTLNDTSANPGILTLGAVNTYNGPTIIQAGTLALGASGSIAQSPTIAISNGAALDVSAQGSNFHLLSNQTLTGAGSYSVVGAMTANSGSIILPGGSTSYGTLNVGSLTLSPGSIINYDIGSGSQDLINVTNSGGLNIAGGGINLYQPDGVTQFSGTGIYALLDYTGGISGAAANLTVLNPNPAEFYSFIDSGSAVEIDISIPNTWNGNGNPVFNWSNSANWSTLQAPSNGGALAFSGTQGLTNYNDMANLNVAGLIFTSSAGAFTLSGNSLQLSGSIVNHSTATQTIGLDIGLYGGNQTIATAPGNIVFSGVISDGGAGLGLNLTGSGNVTLSAANTFSGPTNVTAGTLTLGHSLAVQNSTVNLTNGALGFAGTVTSPTLGGLSGSANIALATATSLPVSLNVGNNGQSTTYAGSLTGPGSLVKQGIGTLTLTAAQGYSGTTNVSGGVLQLAPPPVSGSIGLHFEGGDNSMVTGSNGVFAMGNWNNISTSNSVNLASQSLNDNNGAATTAAVSTSGLIGGIGTTGGTNPLLDGYIYTNNYGILSTTLSGIPYKNYSVYAYFADSTSGNGEVLSLGATNYYFSTTNASTFGQVTNTTGGTYQTGNYVVATGLSGSSQTISVQGVTNQYGSFTGFEIVNTTPAITILPAATPVTISNGATLDVTNVMQTVASLSSTDGFGSQVLLGSGALTIAGTASTTFDGSLQDGYGGNGGSLVMQSGGLRLTGYNSYTGATYISGGSLYAGVANTLSAYSAVTLTGGLFDVSPAAQTIASLTASGGVLNLNIANLLTATGFSTLGGTLNVYGTPSGVTDLISFPSSYSGTFTAGIIPAGYMLSYSNPYELDLVLAAATSSEWYSSMGGSWTGSSNWSGGVPNGQGTTAILGTAALTPATVTLDGAQTLGSLVFNNTNGYTLTAGSGGSLTMDNTGGTGDAQIVVLSGTHSIDATVALTLAGTNTAISASGGGALSIAGNILDGSGGSSALTFSSSDGTGLLTLSGTNTFGGGLYAASGEVVLNGAGSLLAGSSLTIGGGPSPGAVFAPPATTHALANLAPVPEPSTLALIAVLWTAVACYRFSRRSASRKK